MPRFKDQDPNFPERTKIGAGLGDRSQERTIDEIRDYCAKLSRLLAGFTRRFFTDANGDRWEFAGRPVGTDPGYRYGFEVRDAGENEVIVAPSVVSGMGAWATVPKIGTHKLTSTPAPRLSVTAKNWVALVMEVEPASTVIYTEPATDESIYGILEGAGTLVDDKVLVQAFETEDDMAAASQVAAVNPSTGSVVANATYVIPLATLAEGDWVQAGYYGPIGVRMCASGACVILSPARGPGVQVPPEEE